MPDSLRDQINADLKEQNQRQSYLETLYWLSGRTNGVFSGLLQERTQQLLRADRRAVSIIRRDARQTIPDRHSI